MKFFNLKRLVFSFLICIFAVLLITKPEICKIAVARGIILCGRVLIPALYPFSVCVLFIMNSGLLERLRFISTFTEKIFGISSDLFFIMILSMLGGYPIGAKLINETVKTGKLTQKDGGKMLNFCVNAGPAFIVSAVGSGILNSEKSGYILLFSHIVSSFIICLFYRFFGRKLTLNTKTETKKIPLADNFVLSASEGATVTINICSFVILFSALGGYTEYYSKTFSFLKPVLFLSEVTTAVTKTNNIYLISFLLGFAGLSIWCQILTVGKNIHFRLFPFIFFRIIHGTLSLILTVLLLKVFKVSYPAFSNNISFQGFLSVSGISLSISLIIMGIIFIISVSNQKRNIKILEEFI